MLGVIAVAILYIRRVWPAVTIFGALMSYCNGRSISKIRIAPILPNSALKANPGCRVHMLLWYTAAVHDLDCSLNTRCCYLLNSSPSTPSAVA